MAKVTVIPSTINPLTLQSIDSKVKRKVAAYARVSTDSDEQYTSYDAQVKYYTKEIQKHDDWEFVKVYADEGITGTSTKNRKGFKEMIDDALNGKIDLIVTKSISRFARNTVDTLEHIRKLKANGVEVYFEKENLWTLDPKSEFSLTIFGSMAQEESRSISQNVTIGKRWAMQEGHVSFAYSHFLGYEKTKEGLKIVKDEAELVRFIYAAFMKKGKSANWIAKYLNKIGEKTPSGKEGAKWTTNNIISILTNEKYKGDAVLQKTYTPDYLTHKVEKNTGVLEKFYVTDNHEAIIDKEEWDMVQCELRRRREKGLSYSSISIFASKLICGDCGGYYGKKIWHSTDKYRSERFRCNNMFDKGKPKCQTPVFKEEEIKEKFYQAYNAMMQDRDEIIENTKEMVLMLTDTNSYDEIIEEGTAELDVASELIRKHISSNMTISQDQTKYEKKYQELTAKYKAAEAKINKAQEEKHEKRAQKKRLEEFVKELEERPLILNEWSDEIWQLMVEKAVVQRDGTIEFHFNNEKIIKA